MVKYFRLLRTREEIQRLDVEVERLLAFIRHEEVMYTEAIKKLSIENPDLAEELKYQWALRSSINNEHVRRLARIKPCGITGNVKGNTNHTDLEMEEQIALEQEQNQQAEQVTDFIVGIDA